MTDQPATTRPLPLSACLGHSLRDNPALQMSAPQPRRAGPRQSHMMRRALAAVGAINPWTDFVLGPSYGRALPPLPEDRRRA